MYTWIWRHLPGGTAAKGAQTLVLLVAVAALLLFVVFPRIEAYVPFTNVTVGR